MLTVAVIITISLAMQTLMQKRFTDVFQVSYEGNANNINYQVGSETRLYKVNEIDGTYYNKPINRWVDKTGIHQSPFFNN